MLAAWLLLAYDLYGIVSSGPLIGGEERIGRAWELIWAYGLSFVVWCFLGLIFYRLQPSGGLWVFVVSSAATVSAFLLMGNGIPTWPAAIPLLFPVLLTGAAWSGHWTALRLPLLVAALIPCALATGSFGSSAIRGQLGKSAVQAEVRQKNLAEVATIGEDQPLWHWLPLLKEESGVRD